LEDIYYKKTKTTIVESIYDRKSIAQIIEEKVDKKLRVRTIDDAVFLLLVNGEVVGTCFAIDDMHVMSARHNMFDSTVNCDINGIADVVYYLNSAPIPVKVTAFRNPPLGGSIPDSDDWIIFKRSDMGKFHVALSVKPTYAAELMRRRPYITIYHFPGAFQNLEGSHLLRSSYNRVIGAENGKLYLNDFSVISKCSCGGPYVDNLNGNAIGFHLSGSAYFVGEENKNSVEAMNNFPLGFHFEATSTVVVALKELGILA